MRKLVCLFKGHDWGGQGWSIAVNGNEVVDHKFWPTHWKCSRCGKYITLNTRCDEDAWRYVRPSKWERDSAVY